ncbi:MAG: hypothetical protein Kow0069_01060 [Promethearchaeota archaeon]
MEHSKLSAVLVVGGGITGISTALDLADQGYHVHLVERTPSIGGRMAQLDKTFPTLDCSICILAPKMVEVARHPNVNLLTYAEVDSCERTPDGNFRVRVRKKARYVDLAKCTGCGDCVAKCPSKKIPWEFEEGLINRTAIYIPFPQAVPRKATIDAEHCIRLTRGKCGNCEKVCQAGAINYEDQDEFVDLEVASVVLATGYDLIKPHQMKRYNYGVWKNVVTSIEYERMLSASGPTGGHLLRPSDQKKPKTIAYVLCVGSRNVEIRPLCSKFCCMYSSKAAVITKEHEPDVEVTIFYNDLRCIGKNHEEFLVRAEREYGIHYFHGIPGDIQEDPSTGDLIVRHANLDTGEVEERRFELVVLASAVTPKEGTEDLAKVFGLELNPVGFFETKDSAHECETNVEGVYVAGCCQGPDDIANCVAKASAAAALAGARAKPAKEPLVPPPQVEPVPVNPSDPPRVGVFVCHCGINIGGYVDVEEVVEYARTLPNVVFATSNLYTCSEDSQVIIKERVLEHGLNRVIVAACTPRTHEPLFRATLEEVGLNPYLFHFVSIRELDSWVHMSDREAATQKAKDLVRMGVSNVQFLKPLEPIEGPVTPKALVIGGGISGMVAATEIASRGFAVHLVEKEGRLGGVLPSLHRINMDLLDPNALVDFYAKRVTEDSRITVHLNSHLTAVRGSIGAYSVAIQEGEETVREEVGVIVVATGAHEFKPNGYYHYGESPHVRTQQELAEAWKGGKLGDLNGKNVVFIHCVGSREPEGRTYCSLICCSVSVKNALLIKEEFPDANIFVLYRDIRVGDVEEQFYWKARKNVNYIRWTEAPALKIDGDKVDVVVRDINTQETLRIRADEVFLSTPLVAHPENKQVSELLKVPLGPNGFFLEAHPKLRPLDFATDGVYVCGTCQGPKRVGDSISQALGAASRALIPLLNGKVVNEPITAWVKRELCIGCQLCQKACSYGAVGVELDAASGDMFSKVNPLLCKGCGTCAAACPANAIEMHHFSSIQLQMMVEQATQTPAPAGEPKIVAFLCNWCSYAGADNAGVSRFQYPPNIRPIRVMCSGRVDPTYVLQAFLNGADGVFVGGCHIGDCHYIGGNLQTQARVAELKRLLEDVGVDPRRLRLEWVSASEGKKFSEVVAEFTEELKALPPLFEKERTVEVTK